MHAANTVSASACREKNDPYGIRAVCAISAANLSGDAEGLFSFLSEECSPDAADCTSADSKGMAYVVFTTMVSA